MESQRTVLDYLRSLVRHWWLILVCVLVVPLIAVGLGSLRGPLYEASSHVLIDQVSLADALGGLPDSGASLSSDRYMATQAAVARLPKVAAAAVRGAPSGWNASSLLSYSTVTAETNTSLLTFTVRGESPSVVVDQANRYASAFMKFRQTQNRVQIVSAFEQVSAQLQRLEAKGITTGPLHDELSARQRQLTVLNSLQTAQASAVQPAVNAVQLRPNHIRDGAIGLALGLVAGLICALAWMLYDRPPTCARDIAQALDVPLLASLSPARQTKRWRRSRSGSDLVLLANPAGATAEEYRMLRASTSALATRMNAKVLLVTGAASSRELGVTAGNLAVALARSGESVVLVDLDLRAAPLSDILQAIRSPGLADVILGRAHLEHALQPIKLHRDNGPSVSGTRRLIFLPAGAPVESPGDVVQLSGVADTIGLLRSRADSVIVVGPDIRTYSDSSALSGSVDAQLLVIDDKSVAKDPVDRVTQAARLLQCPTMAVVAISDSAPKARDRASATDGTVLPETQVRAPGVATDVG